ILEQDEGPSVVRGRGTGCTADLDSVPIGNSLSPPSTPQTAQAHDSPSPSAASDTLSQQSTEDSVSQEDEILQSPQPEAPVMNTNHPMITRAKAGIVKPNPKYALFTVKSNYP
ncbi:unnamed protein product, partial [Arabidopsis halleri]